MDAYFTAFP